MKAKDYNYRSPIEIQLSQLIREARNERFYNELRPQIEQLQARLTESRKNDLLTFKDQIKLLLEEDIVARYYLERGQVEVSFKQDAEIRMSIDMLNNSAQYRKVLNL
jgi:carboxyl-terminal processing protease